MTNAEAVRVLRQMRGVLNALNARPKVQALDSAIESLEREGDGAVTGSITRKEYSDYDDETRVLVTCGGDVPLPMYSRVTIRPAHGDGE